MCNVPPNKRVEMLRNCEVDLRRDPSKSPKADPIDPMRKDIHAEMLSSKTPPPPASPGQSMQRMSPRKNHITNFIHQNGNAVEVGALRSRLSDSNEQVPHDAKRSPCLQMNASRVKMRPPKSPTPRRRYRSQSPRVCIEESDSEESERSARHRRPHTNATREHRLRHSIKKTHTQLDGAAVNANACNNNAAPTAKMNGPAFRAVDLVNQNTESFYCPQSEPLKRKIYSEKTLDRLQRSLEVESGNCTRLNRLVSPFHYSTINAISISEIPREALLRKISMLRRERQQQAAAVRSHSLDTYDPSGKSEPADKRLLILNTIEDLKRSLEEQSIELRVCDLNANGDE